MRNKLSIKQREQQLQTLSPLQHQYVKMLEMNGPEVEDEVRHNLDENPALEVSDAPTDAEMERDTDVPRYRYTINNHSADDTYYEPVAVSDGESMIESLMRQLSEMGLSDRELMIAQFIVGNIDNNGYLTRTAAQLSDDIAIQEGLEVTTDGVRRVLNIVRQLEPAGIGAVDLRDCMLLQIKRRAEEHPSAAISLAIEILTHYFDLFANRHFDRLASLLGKKKLDLEEAIEVLRSTNPKPGTIFAAGSNDDRTRQITPDFQVDVEEDSVTLTMPNRLPQLQVASTYKIDSNIEPTDRRNKDAATFARQKRTDAEMFIDALKRRQQTLLKVMKTIIHLQREFFLTGDTSTIRPMVLRDVAELTGYDESVISRATNNKYVTTRDGTFPLKFFFSESADNSGNLSKHKVIAALRDIIDNEDKSRPFSDEAITAELRRRGIVIARRTVAKYRESEGYPVGRLRRQLINN